MTEEAKKVLVAEDDNFLMKVYEVKLKKEGFNLVLARDGEEAINKIREEKPDIILLDLVMPKKNGFEVLTEVKSDEQLKNIPILILSNLGQVEDIKKGLDAGADDYIIKSDVSIEEIVEKIWKKLKSSESLTISAPSTNNQDAAQNNSQGATQQEPKAASIEPQQNTKPQNSEENNSEQLSPTASESKTETTSEPQLNKPEETNVPVKTTCPSCNETVPSSAKFCPNCGTKII